MVIVIIQSGPEMFLLFHRNVFGPLTSIDLINGILWIKLFGNICNTLLMTEGLLAWYIIEKILKNQCAMDNVGTAECFNFFTVSISAGLTFLVGSVDIIHFRDLERQLGYPLDLRNIYVVNTG
jgi:hypothetical protein